MKQRNAGEDMWLRALIANQNLKQNVQEQDADGIKKISVFPMTRVEV